MSSKLTVPYFKVHLSTEDIKEVVKVLRSGWLTTGEKCKQFEVEMAKFVGSSYAVALNSCTGALHLALNAINLKRQDLVFVPTLTFTATAEVIRYFDAIPVFIDCDQTLCMDPKSLQDTIEAVKRKSSLPGYGHLEGEPKAIIPMHYGGYMCEMNELIEIAQRFNLTLIEDAAHTIAAYYRAGSNQEWKHAGTFGKIGCFSFYANKCITTGEGGMAVTDDAHIAERIRQLSLHGMSKDAWKRFSVGGSWYYEIVEAGYKYNMTDIAAALGLQQLKKAHQFRERRELIAHQYSFYFKEMPELEIPPEDNQKRIHSWHIYPLRLNLDKLTITRDQFIDELKNRGINCSVHWMPLHLHPYYKNTFKTYESLYPVAEREWRRLISLPIYPAMTEKQINYVIRQIKKTINRFKKKYYILG